MKRIKPKYTRQRISKSERDARTLIAHMAQCAQAFAQEAMDKGFFYTYQTHRLVLDAIGKDGIQMLKNCKRKRK